MTIIILRNSGAAHEQRWCRSSLCGATRGNLWWMPPSYSARRGGPVRYFCVRFLVVDLSTLSHVDSAIRTPHKHAAGVTFPGLTAAQLRSVYHFLGVVVGMQAMVRGWKVRWLLARLGSVCSARWYFVSLHAGWDVRVGMDPPPDDRLIDFLMYRRNPFPAESTGRVSSARQAGRRKKAVQRATEGSTAQQLFPGARTASGRDFTAVWEVLGGPSTSESGTRWLGDYFVCLGSWMGGLSVPGQYVVGPPGRAVSRLYDLRRDFWGSSTTTQAPPSRRRRRG